MTAALWTRNTVCAATGATSVGPDWSASGVSIDTRTLAKGDLFVALAGPNHDGHDHLDAAFAKGAAAALVHRLPTTPAAGPLAVATDTVQALAALGVAARARSTARIAGITGSVGKTSTKEMLRLVLSAQGVTHATQGNLNNHFGAPLSLARMPLETQYGVFELGMNHAGELTPLTRMVRPHVVAITAIELVHAAHFANAEAIADAKAEIFLGLEPGGTAILPQDSPQIGRLRRRAHEAGAAHILTFGSHIESHARLLHCHPTPNGTEVLALLGDRPMSYRIGAVGRHWGANSLAVLLAVEAMGGNAASAAFDLAQMEAPKGRGQRHVVHLESGTAEVIDESYNASPASMKAAFATLAAMRPAPGARRIAVLGDMLELGENAANLHAALATAIESRGIDLVFTAGPLMSNLFKALPASIRAIHAPDSQSVIGAIQDAVRNGDVIMIKGSAGSRMGLVVEALRAIKGTSDAL